MLEEPKKKCSWCKEMKFYTYFYKDKRRFEGRQSECKACQYKKYGQGRKRKKDLFHKRRSNKMRFGGNREAAIQRDKECCVLCGMTRKEHQAIWKRDITVDHIDVNGRNAKIKNHSLDNLQTLCLKCHGRIDMLRYYQRTPHAQRQRIHLPIRIKNGHPNNARILGVYKDSRKNVWEARLQFKKKIFRKHFSSLQEAMAQRMMWEEEAFDSIPLT